ncbi:MAG: Multidomain signal transduction protein including CheB-like methylesterase, CheR-like methyltransferase and BaeS-like histidine kinase [uncultured Caballeronia sp.]|nr:MAG: Multidomain signal transduction protein including CheB-like methylesterase, CheR-like methyltransferase and BaeS-like histidine kinase [uncultured Caballeronia sp.]
MFHNKADGDQVRAWVAGCSSGEEAYSLAMLLSEQRDALHSTANIQVFATDIDEGAVARARAGLYPESIMTDVRPSALRQFFVKTDSRYEVVKSVREKILFAIHNVLRDPPFSRLDLVSCRNLLISISGQRRAEPGAGDVPLRAVSQRVPVPRQLGVGRLGRRTIQRGRQEKPDLPGESGEAAEPAVADVSFAVNARALAIRTTKRRGPRCSRGAAIFRSVRCTSVYSSNMRRPA